MATIYNLPNRAISRMSPSEALDLMKERRANRRIVKPRTIKRSTAGKKQAKKNPNKMDLLAALSPEQARELLLSLGEGID